MVYMFKVVLILLSPCYNYIEDLAMNIHASIRETINFIKVNYYKQYTIASKVYSVN